MIFGECPHCDGTIVNSMPDESPAIWSTDCEHCGKEYWMYASRVEDCMAYPNREELLTGQRLELDEETKTFNRKTETPESSQG